MHQLKYCEAGFTSNTSIAIFSVFSSLFLRGHFPSWTPMHIHIPRILSFRCYIFLKNTAKENLVKIPNNRLNLYNILKEMHTEYGNMVYLSLCSDLVLYISVSLYTLHRSWYFSFTHISKYFLVWNSHFHFYVPFAQVDKICFCSLFSYLALYQILQVIPTYKKICWICQV